MKKLYLFLFILVFILILIIAPVTIIASENSIKILIEESLEYLEQQNYSMAINSLEKSLLLIREKAP